MFLILLMLLIFKLQPPSTACTFLPENDLMIGTSVKNSGLSEEQFNAVIDKVEKVYSPIATKRGNIMQINRLWENPRVNAGTIKKDNSWIINLYGGFARHPQITEDGFALVICHEIGHHIGGAPKKRNTSWSSTEGQADYFATLKCLRQVFNKEDNIAAIQGKEIPEEIQQKCSTPFVKDWETALCIRTTLAGIAAANISADSRQEAFPQIDLPDQEMVGATYEAHPRPQCRLDTYFQGSICEVSSFKSVSQIDSTRGTCHIKNSHTSGLRPGCWFWVNVSE